MTTKPELGTFNVWPHSASSLLAMFHNGELKSVPFLKARPGSEIILDTSKGLDAVRRAAELAPDVAIVDIGMLTLNGIETAKQIRQVSPATRVIILNVGK